MKIGSCALGPTLCLCTVIYIVEIVVEEWQHFKVRQVMVLPLPAEAKNPPITSQELFNENIQAQKKEKGKMHF